MTRPFPKVVFAALESYSLVGGLQQFNRRVVTALAELAQGGPAPVVVLKGDSPEHVADRTEQVEFRATGADRIAFIRETLKAVWRADILLLGHVNLLPVACLARLMRPTLKIVLFAHGEDVWGTPGARPMRRWEPMLIRFVTRVGSVSTFTAKRMARAFGMPVTRFTVFPNAVDPLPATRTPAATREPILLTVARMAAHDGGKHHDSVLRALPLITARVPEARYLIIGDGVLRPKLEALAVELGVADAVDFAGRVSDDDLARAYAEATVFVMTSEKEGFGIVFLEAWQHGLPVICGTADAASEVVSDGIDGYAVHHDDIAGLAARIVTLMEDPTRATAMGAAGQQKVIDRYLMRNFTANLEALLEEVRR